ncbi:hypothetical protein DZG01_02790 [Pseudomonas fluorescens]|nr:hypothetical protein DZG01_02790 [Pseudomonas fluorescens]
MGASLLAIAEDQPAFMSTDTPPSRAGSLPQGNRRQTAMCRRNSRKSATIGPLHKTDDPCVPDD